MRSTARLDFGRSLAWWPLAALLGGKLTRGVTKILALWAVATATAVGLALLEAKWNWSGIPIAAGSWNLGFSFYPPVMISVFLTLWIGPTYGATTAYVATLASGLFGGLSIGRAAFFALGSPVEVLLLWFLMLILRAHPNLPMWRDWGLFAAASLIAATASSVDIMLYNSALHTDLSAGQRLWFGWILGDFAQMVFLVGPVLWMTWTKAHAFALKEIGVPPRRDISTRHTLLLLGSVWVTLGLLVLQGVRLLEEALDIPDFAVTMSGDPLVPRLREMGLFVGVFVLVLVVTNMALTAALAGVGDRHRESSLRDELTGCFNRRAFKRLFERESGRSAGLNRPLSVVFFDIDHFKSLNDRFGHATGDSVLAAVARSATDILSPQELLFRWGGEEFLVLLSHTGADEARLFAERLRARIEETVSVPGRVSPEPVTISLGVATAQPPEFNEANLIGNADAALYGAKESGRNRVMTEKMMRGAPRG